MPAFAEQTQTERGYSLLELLVALTIAAILLQIGAGELAPLAAATEQRNTISALVASIERTRRLAVTMQRQTIMCPLAADDICGENWSSENFAVFVDANNNRKQDEGEQLQFLLPRPGQGFQLTWSNWLGDSTITYRADGSVASNGTLTLSDRSSKTSAQLVISKSGRLRVETPH